MHKALAKQTNIAWRTFRTLLVKHACPFGHHDKHCLTSTFCFSMFFKLFKNIFCLSQSKNDCQATVCVVAKPANIVLDKQNFKCLPNNVCQFGRSLKLWLNDNAMFYKTLIEKNNKEIIAHLRDKHFECCIFNIVQRHQTFVNKDRNKEVFFTDIETNKCFIKQYFFFRNRISLDQNYSRLAGTSFTVITGMFQL